MAILYLEFYNISHSPLGMRGISLVLRLLSDTGPASFGFLGGDDCMVSWLTHPFSSSSSTSSSAAADLHLYVSRVVKTRLMIRVSELQVESSVSCLWG